MYSLIGKMVAAEGKRDALAEILLEASSAMGELEDCHAYTIHINEQESDAVYVYEVWENEPAHQNALKMEVTQRMIQRAKPIISGAERLYTFEALGGKGI